MVKEISKIIKPSIEVSERANGSRSVKLHTGNESNVQQNFKESSDMKYILHKYQQTGELPINKNQALFGEFDTPISYQESLNIQIQAQEQFDAIDAGVRKRFNNDPAEFLAFVNDEKNSEEMIKMGLKNKPPAPAPIPDNTLESTTIPSEKTNTTTSGATA